MTAKIHSKYRERIIHLCREEVVFEFSYRTNRKGNFRYRQQVHAKAEGNGGSLGRQLQELKWGRKLDEGGLCVSGCRAALRPLPPSVTAPSSTLSLRLLAVAPSLGQPV